MYKITLLFLFFFFNDIIILRLRGDVDSSANKEQLNSSIKKISQIGIGLNILCPSNNNSSTNCSSVEMKPSIEPGKEISQEKVHKAIRYESQLQEHGRKFQAPNEMYYQRKMISPSSEVAKKTILRTVEYILIRCADSNNKKLREYVFNHIKDGPVYVTKDSNNNIIYVPDISIIRKGIEKALDFSGINRSHDLTKKDIKDSADGIMALLSFSKTIMFDQNKYPSLQFPANAFLKENVNEMKDTRLSAPNPTMLAKSKEEVSANNSNIQNEIKPNRPFNLDIPSIQNSKTDKINVANDNIHVNLAIPYESAKNWSFIFKDPGKCYDFVPLGNTNISTIDKRYCDAIEFDHTKMHSSVLPQGSWGNCWAHALAALLEEQHYLSQIENNISNPTPIPISRSHIQKNINHFSYGANAITYNESINNFFQKGVVFDPNNAIDKNFYNPRISIDHQGNFFLKNANLTKFYRKSPRSFLFSEIGKKQGLFQKYVNLLALISRNQNERESLLFLLPGHAILVDGVKWIDGQCKFHVQDSFYPPYNEWRNGENILRNTEYAAGFVNPNAPLDQCKRLFGDAFCKQKFLNELSDQAKQNIK